jgi:demethylmenaquinone methyltransferase / 2-methoxy-6-polyprenyl-1,4-benzoquinol methylase
MDSPDRIKPQSQSSPSRREVWRMFDRIAYRYDLLNHLLSLNRDKVWRKRMRKLLPEKPNLEILDLATGTADQLLSINSSGKVSFGVGIDMAGEMLTIGKKKIFDRGCADNLFLIRSDAGMIPFADNSFDLVTISFGIRNLIDVPAGLSEMNRVLKPGGRVLILEFSLPRNSVLRWWYLVYFRHILPKLGDIISGDSQAYRYLNQTVETFPYGKAFCQLMRTAGFNQVKTTSLTFGIAAIYQGDKL